MAATQTNNLTVCGGALVEKQWVLTAAHCELNESEVRVVLGARQASIAEKEPQIFKVMHYFPNPQFGRPSKENDIMLLKLNGIARLDEYVQLLPLPESYRDIKPSTMCEVAGWGVTSSEKLSKCLQETTLKIVDRKICEREYRKYTKKTSNILCAGGKSRFSKRDAYQGDMGGPLIYAG